jgi:hypothetical protein
MLKAEGPGFRKRILITVIALLGVFSGQLSAEVPAAMEKDLDSLNAAFYEALKVIDTESESEALAQLAVMKPKLEAQVRAYAAKWAGTELSDEDEMALGMKMLEKPFYKDMSTLVGSPSFAGKIESSPALAKEYAALMSMMDEEDEEAEEPSGFPAISGATVLSFTVNGAVPYSGAYSVSGNEEQAFAQIDENNLFAVQVSSTLNGGEFEFVILSEEAATGEQKWSMESQIIIQSWDQDQNEAIQLSSYYNEGTITFDVVSGVGGKVSGSFEGKFFDDTQATDQPVEVSGEFSVTRTDDAY